jgi:hypothetical protein
MSESFITTGSSSEEADMSASSLQYADSSSLSSLPNYSSGQNAPLVNSRDCAVYNINDTDPVKDANLRDLCDNGYFDNSSNYMQYRLNQLQNLSTLTTDQLTELSNIVNIYNVYKPTLPNGACKNNLYGWYEPDKIVTFNNQQQSVPYKNSINAQTRNNVKDWAFCYQPITASGSDAFKNANANSIAQSVNTDGPNIIAAPVLIDNDEPSPFNDGQTYTRVAFTTFTVNDFLNTSFPTNNPININQNICAATNLPPNIAATVNNMKNSYLAFKLDSSGGVINYSPVIFSPTTLRFTQVSDLSTLQNIYASLYTYSLNTTNYTLSLTPNPFSTYIHKINADICIDTTLTGTVLESTGRVINKITDADRTVNIQFSLANLNKGDISLYQATSTTDLTYGTLDVLRNNIVVLDADIARNTNIVTALIDIIGKSNAILTTLNDRAKTLQTSFNTDTTQLQTDTDANGYNTVASPAMINDQSLVDIDTSALQTVNTDITNMTTDMTVYQNDLLSALSAIDVDYKKEFDIYNAIIAIEQKYVDTATNYAKMNQSQIFKGNTLNNVDYFLESNDGNLYLYLGVDFNTLTTFSKLSGDLTIDKSASSSKHDNYNTFSTTYSQYTNGQAFGTYQSAIDIANAAQTALNNENAQRLANEARTAYDKTWYYMGCFNENSSSRALPYYIGTLSISSKDNIYDCGKAVDAYNTTNNTRYDTIGIQQGSAGVQCYAGNSTTDTYNKYCLTDCTTVSTSQLMNVIYSKNQNRPTLAQTIDGYSALGNIQTTCKSATG